MIKFRISKLKLSYYHLWPVDTKSVVYRISCIAYPGAVGVLGGAEVVLQEDNHLVNYELVQHVSKMVKWTSFFLVP